MARGAVDCRAEEQLPPLRQELVSTWNIRGERGNVTNVVFSRDTKALVAAEEGIAELQPATAEDEEVSSSDAESTESEEPSKHAIITRVLVEACNAGKSPSNSLSMLVLLDLCAARDGIDGDRHLAVHWAKHLHEDAAGGVVDFLGEITLGYGSCNVWAILEFFRKDITELTRFRLQEANANAATDRRKAKRDRLILADLLQVCLDEAAAGVLVTSNYFAEPWEWAIDPIYEADDYYEHELRLATDGEYANICSKKRAEKERLLEMGHVECQEEWVRLFERALEFVREGPRAGFSSNEGAGGVGQKSYAWLSIIYCCVLVLIGLQGNRDTSKGNRGHQATVDASSHILQIHHLKPLGL